MAGEADFDEWAGSPKGAYSEDGNLSVTRVGVTDWDLVDAFAQYLAPATIVVGDQVLQKPPAQLPSNPLMFVQHFEFEGYGQALGKDFSGLMSYPQAKWTIAYRIPKYDLNTTQDPVPFLNHEWSVGGEVLTLEAKSLQWAQNPTTVNSAMRAGIILPTTETQITWERVVEPPFSAMRNCVGCVNSADITFDTGTCSKETLLFIGAKLSRQVMSDGSRAWKVGYQFSEKISPRQLIESAYTSTYPNGGWNFFHDPDTGKFRRMTSAGGSLIYNTADFNTLFKAG